MKTDQLRPFYGLIWGTWALGVFIANKSVKFAYWKPETSFVKFYGFMWKHRFFGSRRGWSFVEQLEALVELAELGLVPTHAVLKFENHSTRGEISPEHRKITEEYLSGKLVPAEAPKPTKVLYTAHPTATPIVRNNRTRELMLQASIEHHLRKPRYAKLFELASERYGRDVVLEAWPRNWAAWEKQFKDELPALDERSHVLVEDGLSRTEAARVIAEDIAASMKRVADQKEAEKVDSAVAKPEVYSGFGTSSLQEAGVLMKAIDQTK